MDTVITPENVTHALISWPAIAAGVRGLIGALKLPQTGALWLKMPWWAKPLTLLGLTGLAITIDALGAGQKWWLAVLSGFAGLGSAVISYEWQELYKDAKAASAATATPLANVKT